MANRAQLRYGDEGLTLPEAAASDVTGAADLSGDEPWSPTKAREVLDKQQRIVTELTGLTSAQSSRTALMDEFRGADRGSIVPPTAGQVAAAGGGAAGAGGFGLTSGTGGGMSGVFGQIAGAIGTVEYGWNKVGQVADFLNTPGGASVGGDAFAGWQQLQQSAIEQQRSSQKMNAWARTKGLPAAGAGIAGYGPGGVTAQAQDNADADSGTGPASHGSKPAQGN